MEFNVSSAELLKGLSDVARAIPAKSPISILENFLFTVKDGNLEITASDQELTLRTNISVDAREDGSMAVPTSIFPSKPLPTALSSAPGRTETHPFLSSRPRTILKSRVRARMQALLFSLHRPLLTASAAPFTLQLTTKCVQP